MRWRWQIHDEGSFNGCAYTQFLQHVSVFHGVAQTLARKDGLEYSTTVHGMNHSKASGKKLRATEKDFHSLHAIS